VSDTGDIDANNPRPDRRQGDQQDNDQPVHDQRHDARQARLCGVTLPAPGEE
jgi:hypothetical protein